MKTLKIGIASYERMKARTLAVARGEHKPGKGEPKVEARTSWRLGATGPRAQEVRSGAPRRFVADGGLTDAAIHFCTGSTTCDGRSASW